jgi:hypothetical protein
MAPKPAQPGDITDDHVLMQRLAAVAHVSDEPAITSFRRRRSSGLLFQIRRRLRHGQFPTSSVPVAHPPA